MPITDADFDTLSVDGTPDPEVAEPEGQPAELPEPEPEPEPPPAAATPQTRYGSKIKQLKEETKTERTAREAAEAEVDRLRQRLESIPKVAEAPQTGTFSFPSMEDWYKVPGNENKAPEAFYDERTDARYRWNDQQAAAQHYERSLDTRYDASLALVKAMYPDVDQVMSQNVEDTRAGKIPPLGVELRHAIRESDVSALVAYHLAGHPEEFVSMNALRGRMLVKAMARLEGRLETVNTGSVSAAPQRTPRATPISPVGSGGADVPPESRAIDDEDSADITLTRDWVNAENKREWERRGRR